MQKNSHRILLFIPIYNCSKQISRVLKSISPEVIPYLDEIIIVDNGSTDGSREVAESILKKIPLPSKILLNCANYNLGGSHKIAFNYAIKHNFDSVLVLHGDDQADIRDILPELKNDNHLKYDCLLGGRFFMRGSKLIGYKYIRIIGNYLFHTLFTLASHKLTCDMGSGINLYSAKLIKKNLHYFAADNLTFHCYYLLNIFANSIQYRYFPITWRTEDQVSNAKLVKQSIEILKILTKYIFHQKKFLSNSYGTLTIMEYQAKIIYESNIKSGN
jgi:glycosyltransferase involved in cell wall biosynthesis